MPNVLWKPIENYPGYFCSSDGKVSRNTKLLKPVITEKGYLHIRIYKEGKQFSFKVHRLVYMVFVGPIADKMEINHINGVKADNRVSNLEMVTHVQNMRHAVYTKLLVHKRGEDHILSTPIIATSISTGEKLYFSGQCEAKRQGFNQGNIQSVLRGRRKSHKGYIWEYDPEGKPRRQALIIDKNGTKPYI